MAVKLNLLPEEFTVSKSLATVLKIVRPLNVTLLGIFLAAALGMAGFFVFSSITLKNLIIKNNSLKRQIENQQAAQQQIILLKDRLGKALQVLSLPNSTKALSTVTPYINLISENSPITELDLSPQKTALTVTFKSNADLTNFMRSLNSQSSFSRISLDSFSYTPGIGYLVGLSLVGKN